MADLTTIQASIPIIIVGSDSTGNETNPVAASSNGDLGVSDGISSGGVFGDLILTTANTALEAKVGGSRLVNRKNLTICPVDAIVYWGFASTVTISTGTPIFKNQFVNFNLDSTDANAAIYIVSATAAANIRITETP